MLKVPVEEAPRNSFATRHETMNSCRSPSFCCPFFFRIALQQISEPVLPSNRFSGGELEVTRRIRLGVYCLTWIDDGCPRQPPTCLHYLDFQVETCRPQNAVFLPVFRPSFP